MKFFRQGRSHYGNPVVGAAVASRTGSGNSRAFPIKNNHTLSLTSRVVSLTGTAPSVTVTVQHSQDGSTWRDHTAFPAQSTAGTERLVLSGVDEYWRVSWSVTETVEFGVSGSVR